MNIKLVIFCVWQWYHHAPPCLRVKWLDLPFESNAELLVMTLMRKIRVHVPRYYLNFQEALLQNFDSNDPDNLHVFSWCHFFLHVHVYIILLKNIWFSDHSLVTRRTGGVSLWMHQILNGIKGGGVRLHHNLTQVFQICLVAAFCSHFWTRWD